MNSNNETKPKVAYWDAKKFHEMQNGFESTKNEDAVSNLEELNKIKKKMDDSTVYGMSIKCDEMPGMKDDSESMKRFLKDLACPKPTRIFISQPMARLSDEEVMKTRISLYTRFIKYLFNSQDIPAWNVSLIDNFTTQPKWSDAESIIPLLYLSHDINKLAYAHFIVMANGWDIARGCRIEHEIAKEYGIPIYYETSDPNKFISFNKDCMNCQYAHKCPPHDCPEIENKDGVCCKHADEDFDPCKECGSCDNSNDCPIDAKPKLPNGTFMSNEDKSYF